MTPDQKMVSLANASIDFAAKLKWLSQILDQISEEDFAAADPKLAKLAKDEFEKMLVGGFADTMPKRLAK